MVASRPPGTEVLRPRDAAYAWEAVKRISKAEKDGKGRRREGEETLRWKRKENESGGKSRREEGTMRGPREEREREKEREEEKRASEHN